MQLPDDDGWERLRGYMEQEELSPDTVLKYLQLRGRKKRGRDRKPRRSRSASPSTTGSTASEGESTEPESERDDEGTEDDDGARADDDSEAEGLMIRWLAAAEDRKVCRAVLRETGRALHARHLAVCVYVTW